MPCNTPKITLISTNKFLYHLSKGPAAVMCQLPLGRSLRWRHNGQGGVSNHQPRDCLLNRIFRCRSKKTSKLRVTGLCAGNSPGTGEFPAQKTSYAENISISWRHHVRQYSYPRGNRCHVSIVTVFLVCLENIRMINQKVANHALFRVPTTEYLGRYMFHGSWCLGSSTDRTSAATVLTTED